jgi:Domain of unknown function (DUF6984)
MNSTEWRKLAAAEEELLALLLSAEFRGKEAVARQLSTAWVRTIDNEGSLAFKVSTSEKAAVDRRIPIEAEANDLDDVTIHMLLHIVDGVVFELEFYREDSAPIFKLPSVREWRLIELHG